jgi:aminoglycoside 6'-N-acetyltransferase I
MARLTVRPVDRADVEAWLRLRIQLWPEGTELEHREEIARYLAGQASEPMAVFVAESHGLLVGFAELAIRPFAEGCYTDRVAYLEGWFVAAAERRKGIGRALVQAAERWARQMGCTEFASDTAPTNVESINAHSAVGFGQVGTVLCFRKKL